MADDQDNGLGNQIKEAAKQEVKKQAKQKLKTIIISILPYIVIILGFLVVASAVYALFSSLVDLVTGWTTELSYTTGDNGIEIDDEKLDALIESIEATGMDLEDLELLR